MAKRATADVNPLDTMMQHLASPPSQPIPETVNDPPADERTQRSDRPTAVLVEVPIADSPPSEFTLHIDMKLTPPQSTVARRVAARLDHIKACLKNGQRVTTPSAALKWMLEQVEKELGT